VVWNIDPHRDRSRGIRAYVLEDVAPIIFDKVCQLPSSRRHRPNVSIDIRSGTALGEVDSRKGSARADAALALDSSRGTFSNDRRLSDQDKEIISRWVAAGAPQGDPKDVPATPKFTEGWEIGTPDVVLAMPKPFTVPASGTIYYQYFVVPTNFTEDKWIQAIEVRPGVRSVVHHVLVFAREPGSAARPAGYSVVVPKPFRPGGGTPSGPGTLVGTTAPGTNAMTFGPGMQSESRLERRCSSRFTTRRMARPQRTKPASESFSQRNRPGGRFGTTHS